MERGATVFIAAANGNVQVTRVFVACRPAMVEGLRHVIDLKFEGAFGQAGEKRHGLER
jgi:hypothetical protein